MQSRNIKAWALASTLLTGVGASPAFGQAAETAAEEGDTITVTGSRIVREDFVSNSPVSTVSSEQFELTGTVNTESLLNTLPQTIPGFDRTSNNPGNGTATVNLRGLGTARTLVLVNGTRMVPSTQGGVVDINNIPTPLIERVEVVTGGASAVYGSDAVAGVVNFILKDDFEGAELRAGYEITEEGDAAIANAGMTFGANFDNGRGNVVMDIAWNDRDALFQGDRGFAEFAQFDAGDGTTFNGGSSGIPGTSIFAGSVGPGTALDCSSSGVTFTPAGDVRCFQDVGANNDFYNYAPVNYIQLPQERFQVSTLGRYEINRHAEIYARGLYSYNKVPQQLAPTPIFQVTDFSIDESPFLTPSTQALLSDAFGNGTDTDGDGIDDTGGAFVRRRLLEVGPRITDDLFNAFQLKGGVRGEINDNFSYDVYYQEGRVLNSLTQLGNVNRDRFDQALIIDPANPSQCLNTSANGATVGCAPLNIFGEGNISEQAAEFLRVSVSADNELIQRVAAATITGDTEGFLELPGGPIGVAAGVEYRFSSGDFRPSQDLAAGTIAGFNGAPPSGGSFDVYDIYGEFYAPILEGAPFAEILALEGAYRYSEYSTAGGVDAWKLAGEWAPVADVRFRASYNTAVRAPSVSELFSPLSEGFPGAVDPCSANGVAASNPPGLAALCQATGVPAGNFGSVALNAPAGQIRGLFGGNPDLDVEEAETFTIGAVITPSLIDNLTVTVDYFDVEITDAIASFGGSVNNVLQTCYFDSAVGGAGSDFCNVINRRADGTIDFVSLQSQNAASIELSGVDLSVDYSFALSDLFGAFAGDMNIAYLGTFTEKNDFTPFEGAETITCAGEFGLTCGEPDPEYRHRTTFTWLYGDLTSQLVWRYIGETEDDDPSALYFAETLSAESYFDASVAWDVTDAVRLTVGVDNLLDMDPPLIGDNQEQANTYPATYDVFGRTYFANIRARF